jgi:uncharacterized protein
MKPLRFSMHPGEWAIARLTSDAPIPAWALASPRFASLTRTANELSIVVPAADVPETVQAERGWSLLQLLGPFAFDQTGILASFARPLAEAGIGIFALSTYDTDYLLVKADACERAVRVLQAAGHART